MSITITQLNGVDKFIEECFQRFGSMNKNNYEVALFHLLMQNGYESYTDFEMSKMLRIPESKIKRLRYEVELNYGTEDDVSLDKKIVSLLKQGSCKLTFDRIQFAVPDKMTRLYLNNKLQTGSRFSDSSFNSNIVSITANDLKYLLDQFHLDKQDRTEIIDRVKKGIKESCEGMPQTAKEKTLSFGKTIIRIVAGKACETIIDDLVNELSTLYHNYK